MQSVACFVMIWAAGFRLAGRPIINGIAFRLRGYNAEMRAISCALGWPEMVLEWMEACVGEPQYEPGGGIDGQEERCDA